MTFRAHDLDAARRVVDRFDELAPLLRADTTFADQAQAAVREGGPWGDEILEQLHGLIGGRRRDFEHVRAIPAEAHTRVVAGLATCDSCIHLRRAPMQPAFANLGNRTVSCRRCAGQVHRPPPGTERLCDFCGEDVPAELFTLFVFHIGGLVVGGDAGPCCTQFMNGVEAIETPEVC